MDGITVVPVNWKDPPNDWLNYGLPSIFLNWQKALWVLSRQSRKRFKQIKIKAPTRAGTLPVVEQPRKLPGSSDPGPEVAPLVGEKVDVSREIGERDAVSNN